MYCSDCGFWQEHKWHDVTMNYHWLTSMKTIKFFRCNECMKINETEVVFA